jgi:hypothetical protein
MVHLTRQLAISQNETPFFELEVVIQSLDIRLVMMREACMRPEACGLGLHAARRPMSPMQS